MLRRPVAGALLFVLGVTLLGLIDDLLGGRKPAGALPDADAPRGWRGHGRAAAEGRPSTGLLKAVGVLGLALLLLSGGDDRWYEYLLSVAVLALSTNLFNLVDLRPGRAVKLLVIVGVGLTVGEWSTDALEVLAPLLGPVVVLGAYDLRERAMLGDAGSNALGALAGLWLVLTLPPRGQLIALVVLGGITLYGEFRSISALVERNPLLRRLDSIGRLRTPENSHRMPLREGIDG
jgi:UDP-N-acetylmuramyl pentapeptide phosphotransferase/UDP-N-acetylglucosamine-1-phosphate transferase